MIIDNLEEMLAQSAHQPLVMGIALHAHISGQPFRLRHLRRVFAMLDAATQGILADAGGVHRRARRRRTFPRLPNEFHPL